MATKFLRRREGQEAKIKRMRLLFCFYNSDDPTSDTAHAYKVKRKKKGRTYPAPRRTERDDASVTIVVEETRQFVGVGEFLKGHRNTLFFSFSFCEG